MFNPCRAQEAIEQFVGDTYIQRNSDVADGKEAFLAAKCNTCHAVQAAEIEAKMQSEKMKGPDLDSSVAKIDATELNNFLKKQGQLNGEDHKKRHASGAKNTRVRASTLSRAEAPSGASGSSKAE